MILKTKQKANKNISKEFKAKYVVSKQIGKKRKKKKTKNQYEKKERINMRKLIVINFFGGPGAGKSVAAAATFSHLKKQGVNCELVTEYIKSKIWEGTIDTEPDQLYIVANQHHMLHTLKGKVDVAITDSPILLSLIYNAGRLKHLDKTVFEAHKKYNNMNIFIQRNGGYEPTGRIHTREEAIEIDKKIISMLKKLKIPYVTLKADKDIVENVMRLLTSKRRNAQWQHTLV